MFQKIFRYFEVDLEQLGKSAMTIVTPSIGGVCGHTPPEKCNYSEIVPATSKSRDTLS